MHCRTWLRTLLHAHAFSRDQACEGLMAGEGVMSLTGRAEDAEERRQQSFLQRLAHAASGHMCQQPSSTRPWIGMCLIT